MQVTLILRFTSDEMSQTCMTERGGHVNVYRIGSLQRRPELDVRDLSAKNLTVFGGASLPRYLDEPTLLFTTTCYFWEFST